MRCILDADGTLIDSTKRHGALLKSLTEKYRIRAGWKEEAYLEEKRAGNTTLGYCVDKLGIAPETAEAICREWAGAIEGEDLLKLDRVYDDAWEFLTFAREYFSGTVLLTARQREELLLRELKELGLSDFFCRVVVVSPFRAEAEKGAVLFHMAKTEPGIYIGDMETDYRAARTAGCASFILNRGFRSRKYLEGLGIPSSRDLTEVRKQIKGL